MRVDRFGDVAGRAAHFDRQHGFGDQLACPGADDANAEHAFRIRDRSSNFVNPSVRPNETARPLAAQG